MSNKNSTTLLIGGEERTLTFSMNTLELFMSESKKITESGADAENDYTRMKLLFYCALKVGDRKVNKLPSDFSIDDVFDWIEECDQEAFEEANEMAIQAMGFIEQAEQRAFDRRMNQLKAMGKNPADIVDKALSANS